MRDVPMLNIVKTNNVPLLQPDSLPLDLVEGAASSMRIAVLVPCFNEEAAEALVVADFRKALPSAEIFVYDNNSSDRTSTVAREAGAQVRCEDGARARVMWSGACSPIS